MSHVRLEGVTKRFGMVDAIRNLSLEVEKGQFCALLGPSGCGKSTLLRMIAGLETSSEGDIYVAGRNVTDVPPAHRSIAMVFQSYALYPHMTVRQNIAFSLDIAGMPKGKANARADEAARMLQLEHLMDRKPGQLSGGQRQRVAIGRALVREPEVFLFDEPLSNLDATLRVQMRFEIARLHQQLGTTMIYVTHDQVEAMTLASKIVVLDHGQISQVGTPLELYHSPANKFVAAFIGSPSMNFLPGTFALKAGKPMIALNGAGDVACPDTVTAREGDAVELGIRPEHVRLGRVEQERDVKGRVQLAERLGNATIVHVETPAGRIIVQGDGEMEAEAGQPVSLVMPPERIHIFSDGQSLLRRR